MSIELKPTSDSSPLLNEQLWQAWLWKGRQQDKMMASNRLKLLKLLLMIAVAAAIAQSVLK